MVFIWIYSTVAGIKGIVWSDVLQGAILFTMLLALGVMAVAHFGGVGELFAAAESALKAAENAESNEKD